MPQHSPHPLVYILLMWITIISIIQVVFITCFFTMGQNGQSSSKRVAEPSVTNDPLFLSTPSITATPPTKNHAMITYITKEEKTPIKWIATLPQHHLISESGETLQILKDGFYFLSLHVTLSHEKTQCAEQNHDVMLESNGKVLLKGGIDKNTKTSGQLSRVGLLRAGGSLNITIQPPTNCVDNDEAETHLDIIFLQ